MSDLHRVLDGVESSRRVGWAKFYEERDNAEAWYRTASFTAGVLYAMTGLIITDGAGEPRRWNVDEYQKGIDAAPDNERRNGAT